MDLEKEMKMWKVYNDNDEDNDKLWSEKLTSAFGLGELKKKEGLMTKTKTNFPFEKNVHRKVHIGKIVILNKLFTWSIHWPI